MGKELAKELPIIGGTTNEIVLYQPDDTIKLEVRLQDETVWLNQQQIAVLFGTAKRLLNI